jgi:molybdopterin-guanine dinucleotide biosynthesis adapter protein
VKIIGITGYSGAGKTTLLLKLIPALMREGFSVSTLKHAHHAFDVDVVGKDSYEHRAAGASEVLISSKNRFALMGEWRGEPEPPLYALLEKLKPVDFVLVEGFKTEHHPKLIIHRVANEKPPLWADLTHVKALITDDKSTDFAGDIAHIDDLPAIIALVKQHAELFKRG